MQVAPLNLNVMPDAELDRTKYLGGSDIAAIMGLGAYGKTPLSVYLHKIGENIEQLDPDQKRFLERRKRWEGPIVEMLREEFDCHVTDINKRYVDAEYPFIAGEIDFEWIDPETGLIENGEIKTVSPFAFGENMGWGEAGTDEIPVHYAAQCMHNLGIMGRRVCIVAAMVGLDHMIFYRIERDEETITEMRARCVHFWTEHVLKRVPPDPVSLEDCMRIALKMRGKPVEADDEMVKNLRDLADIRGQMSAFDGEKNDVMFKIGSAILKQWGIPAPAVTEKGALAPAQVADNALILRAGQQIASWNLQNTTRIDPKALREAMPEVFQKFSRSTPSRVLRIKNPKST